MSFTLRTILGIAVFGVALAASAGSAPPPPPREPAPQPDDQRFEVRITPEMVRHSRIRNVLYLVANAYSLAVLLIVLGTGLSRRMRDLARRAVRWRIVQGMLYFAMFTILTWLLEFPLAYYSGFVVPHQFDLTDRSFASWIGEQGKWQVVTIAIFAPVAAGTLFLMRRYRRWWLTLWLASIPLILLALVIYPLFIEPLFNRYEPLRDQTLKARLLDMASRAGIEGSRVYQVDKSKQTKTMNAYVTGIGPSKRIVMWDTLLAKMNRDEVVGVMAHEMGHYVLHHLWKGTGFGIAVSFFGFLVAQPLFERGVRRWGRKWGVHETDRGDPAALPWLMLIAGAIGFLLSPVTNGFSRHIEHQADIFAIELTGLNEPMATAFRKLSEDSKTDPDPHPLIEFWRYSHPSINKRIEFVLEYRR